MFLILLFSLSLHFSFLIPIVSGTAASLCLYFLILVIWDSLRGNFQNTSNFEINQLCFFFLYFSFLAAEGGFLFHFGFCHRSVSYCKKRRKKKKKIGFQWCRTVLSCHTGSCASCCVHAHLIIFPLTRMTAVVLEGMACLVCFPSLIPRDRPL